jgi:SAM-dependent methyltransferase
MTKISEIEAYWQAQPCGIKNGEGEVGTAFWSHGVSERRYFVESHIPAFADFKKWDGKKVLEIGCGIGTDTLKFASSGALVDAVELSSRSRIIAMQRFDVEGLGHLISIKRVNFYLADAEKFLPDGPYDLIYSFGVLHHTPRPEMVLTKAARRLAPGGELRVMLYARWSLKHLLGIQPEAQAGCPLVRWYSERSARHLLESCGFRVLSIRKVHIFPWRIKDYVQYRYVKAFPWNVTPDWLFRKLELHIGHHLLIRAVKA